MTRLFAFSLLLAALSAARGQQNVPNTKLPLSDFRLLAARCAPNIAADTIEHIARTESSFHVAALSLNRPRDAARRSGWTSHTIQLRRQPATIAEAIGWMHWFATRGYTVSVGIVQVSTENASRFGITPEQLFDPCTNLAVGGAILANNYTRALQKRGNPAAALLDSISEYNSGSLFEGYANGYVGNVLSGRPVAP